MPQNLDLTQKSCTYIDSGQQEYTGHLLRAYGISLILLLESERCNRLVMTVISIGKNFSPSPERSSLLVASTLMIE